MEKSKKGLADTQEGEFILNESGTAVSIDPVEGVDIPAPVERELNDKKDDKQRVQEAEHDESHK